MLRWHTGARPHRVAHVQLLPRPTLPRVYSCTRLLTQSMLAAALAGAPLPTPCPAARPLAPCRHEQSTQPRGIIEVNRCLSIKGAEDAINKPHAFEISTTDQNMYFIADSDKVGPLTWQPLPASALASCARLLECMAVDGTRLLAGQHAGQQQGMQAVGSVPPPGAAAVVAWVCCAGEGGLDQRGGAGNCAALQEVRKGGYRYSTRAASGVPGLNGRGWRGWASRGRAGACKLGMGGSLQAGMWAEPSAAFGLQAPPACETSRRALACLQHDGPRSGRLFRVLMADLNPPSSLLCGQVQHPHLLAPICLMPIPPAVLCV